MIERVIKTTRNELLDRVLFWNKFDLQNKLDEFQNYYNRQRSHWSLNRMTPLEKSRIKSTNIIDLNSFVWKKHCRGLFELPIAV